MALRLQCTITLLHPYNGHIPGRTRDFQIPAYVRYSSEEPTTPGGPLRPDRRRPWGPTDHSLTTPRQDACVARSSPIFVFRPEDPRDGPSPRLLLTSASLLLTSCLRAPSATGPKVVSPIVAPRSLGPIFGRGAASTPWAPLASRSATLRAGRRDGSRRSTVRVHL